MPTPLRYFTSPEHAPFHWQAGENAALLVHGFAGSPRELRPLAAALHEAGWSVHGLLLPGFARDFDRLFTVKADEWTRTVEDALAHLQYDYAKTVLVGNSIGAALALHAAAHAAAPVHGLLLVAPFWRISMRLFDLLAPVLAPLLPDLRPFARADFSDPEVRATVRTLLDGADLGDPEVQRQARAFTLPTHALAQARLAGQRGMAAAPSVRSPVLICQGTRDALATPVMTRRLARRLPALAGYVEVDSDHELAHMRSERERHLLPLVQVFAAAIAQGSLAGADSAYASARSMLAAPSLRT